MQSSVALILAALAAAAQAVQFDFSNSGFSPEAGVPITLKWSGAEGPVTITLKNGPSGDLKTVEVLTSGDTDGEFTWTPAENIPTGTYALEITDGTETNYTPQFELVGGAPASTSATPSATSSSVSSTITETSTESSTMMTSTVPMVNTTMTHSNMTSTKTTATTTKETTAEETDLPTTTPVNQNGSQRLASSLALVIGAVAAFVTFN